MTGVQTCALPISGYSYEWSTGENTKCITISNAGTYAVTVTNASGCSSVCSKTITVNGAIINCSITGCSDNAICDGQWTSLCAASGAGYTYEWTTGATTRCIMLNTPGFYCVTITNSSGCTSVCSRTITRAVEIPCAITGCNSGTMCAGQAVSLCAVSGVGYTYEWTTGATTRCIMVNTPGFYCVTVTNSSGCTSVCSRTITRAVEIPCTITGCNSGTM